jgi:hypothetical protein
MPAPSSQFEALAADPFMSIMDALPEHVRLSRPLLGLRTALLLAIGVAFLAVAWWVNTQ